MLKRVSSNVIINLLNVSTIEIVGNTIYYRMSTHRFFMIFGSGGSDDIIHKVKYSSEEEAKKEFDSIKPLQ
jgi:hypothetical protein